SKTIMTNAGSSLMGIGTARGENRAAEAARNAISSPLLEASVEGARGVLLNICGGSDLGLFEVHEAAEIVAKSAHPDANIIFGAVVDDQLGDEVRVTVIASGFDRWVTQPVEAPATRVLELEPVEGEDYALEPFGGPAPTDAPDPVYAREPVTLPGGGRLREVELRDGVTILMPPVPGVVFTTRRGGASARPFASLNLSASVGDHPACVAANRERVSEALGIPRGWAMARQVH